jgi:hypothetical protein
MPVDPALLWWYVTQPTDHGGSPSLGRPAKRSRSVSAERSPVAPNGSIDLILTGSGLVVGHTAAWTPPLPEVQPRSQLPCHRRGYNWRRRPHRGRRSTGAVNRRRSPSSNARATRPRSTRSWSRSLSAWETSTPTSEPSPARSRATRRRWSADNQRQSARIVLERPTPSSPNWNDHLDDAERNRNAAASLVLVCEPAQNNGSTVRCLGSCRIVMAFDPATDGPGLLRTVTQLSRNSALTARTGTGSTWPTRRSPKRSECPETGRP